MVLLALALVGLASAGVVPGCTAPKSPPVLLSVEPPDGTRNADRSALIILRFDQPMDPAAATLASIDPPVAGGWYVQGDTVVFEPVEPLTGGTTYRVSLRPGAPGRGGLLSNSSGTFSFTVRPPVVNHPPSLQGLDPLDAPPGVKALAFGPSGKLYAASETEVYLYGPTGFAPYSAGWKGIEDIDVDVSGRLWLLTADSDTYRAVRLSGPTAAAADLVVPVPQPANPKGQGRPSRFYPKCLKVRPDGDLLVLGTDRLLRLGPDGSVKAELGLGILEGSYTGSYSAGSYSGPAGMVLADETVWVENGKASPHNRGIVELSCNPAGAAPKVFRFGVGRNEGLARDDWGNFYTAKRLPSGSVRLAVYGPEGDPLEPLFPAGSGAAALLDLGTAAAPGELLFHDGVLYVADAAQGRILRFSVK